MLFLSKEFEVGMRNIRKREGEENEVDETCMGCWGQGLRVRGEWVKLSHVTEWPHLVTPFQTNPDSLTLSLLPGKWDQFKKALH